MTLTLLLGGFFRALLVILRGGAVHLPRVIVKSGRRLELLVAVLAVERDPAMFPVHVNFESLPLLVGLVAHRVDVALLRLPRLGWDSWLL